MPPRITSWTCSSSSTRWESGWRELSGAESGMVTSGAAGAMAVATAACIAGADPEKIWRLPDTTGQHEVVMLGGRSAFDNAIRLTGAKLVLVHGTDHLQSAISEKTRMIYTTWRDDRLAKAVAVARSAGVPLLLDDAAGIPPIENLTRYAKAGVDLYCFSGGKGLRGPAVRRSSAGTQGSDRSRAREFVPVGGFDLPPMKVGKEEMIGMLAAIEAWEHMDLNALNKAWQRRVERIAKLVETVPGVTTKIEVPEDGNSYPTLTVKWDEAQFGMTVAQCDQELRAGEPRIEVLTNSNPSLVKAVHEGDPKSKPHDEPNQLQIVSMTLQDGEELVIGKRMREILSAARRKSGGKKEASGG